eukprot:1491376-Rhodomonas_salina.1
MPQGKFSHIHLSNSPRIQTFASPKETATSNVQSDAESTEVSGSDRGCNVRSDAESTEVSVLPPVSRLVAPLRGRRGLKSLRYAVAMVLRRCYRMGGARSLRIAVRCVVLTQSISLPGQMRGTDAENITTRSLGSNGSGRGQGPWSSTGKHYHPIFTHAHTHKTVQQKTRTSGLTEARNGIP